MSTPSIANRVGALAAYLPDAPPVPDAVREMVRRQAPTVVPLEAVRRRRAWRDGRILAAAVATAAIVGVAGAGVLHFALPEGAERQLAMDQAVVAGTFDATSQRVLLAPGAGANAGLICMSLTDARGAADVSPLACGSEEQLTEQGLHHAALAPDVPARGVHVRLARRGDLSTAIVTGFVVPTGGGAVPVRSGDRPVTVRYPDTRPFDARADADAARYAEQLLRKARAGLASPESQAALGRLSPEQRRALELRLAEPVPYPYPLIAEMLGTDIAGARTLVSQALRTLGIDMQGMLP